MLKKPPETPEKRPKTSENVIFRMIFSGPKIVLGWLFGPVLVVSRILGEFWRHKFLHLLKFLGVYRGYIRDISGVYQGHIPLSLIPLGGPLVAIV